MSRKTKAFTGNLGDVDLRLLRVFRSVVDCQGFVGAEAQLGIGKSTLSKHISDLESRLGVRLCLRGRAGFATTVEGAQIYDATVRLFAAHENFKASISEVQSRLSGALALGLVDTIVTDRGSPLHAGLAAFASNAPDVHLQLSIGSTTDIEKRVLDASLQAGIVVGRGEVPGLHYTPFYDEPSALYCGEAHMLFDYAEADIGDDALAAARFVRASYSEIETTNLLKAQLHPAATADHAEAVALLVLSGLFIGFLPEHYARSWVAEGRMRALRPDHMRYHSRIMVVTRRGAPLSTVTEYLLEELERAARSRDQG